ncbi:Plant UBX domain-containing protein 10 [Camellia lanceoleosa]|uniref:Plant UBX domain-containing protein 10 n=1 Tax=Camellia lanceoleosa TaxID=1840588 RepID=A0ACC0F7Z8_9ERIC|nr:Plant UBX domain-containing protein 10 [Camellia lanceoleosa]
MMRGSTRATGEAFCNGIVRRMVSLPRSLLGGFSRAMNHGIDLIGIGGRRNQQDISPSYPLPYPPEPVVIQEEWAFLSSFEQQYGTTHPFFYACRFVEALKIAEDDHKFMFLYLHSPEHPFTPSFCRETLCSEVVVQFLDANFVCWGALANRGEGLQMGATLQPGSFPFCAIVAPASGDNLAVLQQIEGPVSPAELVEILQRTMEEQGLAFGSARAKEKEKRRADQRLREEQDAAYAAALQADQEREILTKNLHSEARVQKQAEASNRVNNEKDKQSATKIQHSKVKEATTSRETQPKDVASRENGAQVTQILIRFPNGEKREQSFLSSDKVQAIYRYIDSVGLGGGVGNYRLISSFPRKVYGVDQMGLSLKDAGLHPRASLFLELL